jgi:hypothetical protein
MTERTGPTRYEIEIGGHASDRVLRPVIDEFTVELTGAGTTRLIGEIRDSSHLNGLLAHLTSLNVEMIGLRRLHGAAGIAPTIIPTHPSNPSKEQP